MLTVELEVAQYSGFKDSQAVVCQSPHMALSCSRPEAEIGNR